MDQTNFDYEINKKYEQKTDFNSSFNLKRNNYYLKDIKFKSKSLDFLVKLPDPINLNFLNFHKKTTFKQKPYINLTYDSMKLRDELKSKKHKFNYLGDINLNKEKSNTYIPYVDFTFDSMNLREEFKLKKCKINFLGDVNLTDSQKNKLIYEGAADNNRNRYRYQSEEKN